MKVLKSFIAFKWIYLSLGGIYVAMTLWGLKSWIQAHPVIQTPSFKSLEHSKRDWGYYLKGAVVKVSSYDTFHSHHPLFVIDGIKGPHLVEKWVSSKKDRAPWLLIQWPFKLQIDEVVLAYAGILESHAYNMSHYEISCLDQNAQVMGMLQVQKNQKSLVHHDLSKIKGCHHTSMLRITWQVKNIKDPQGVVRLYEIEIHGRKDESDS